MIKAGLCSVSFKQKTPREVVELTLKAGLCGIEWIGNVHVPAGDVSNARKVGELTRNAGLEIAAYGSIFRLGTGDDIVPHLESAVALGAREMRIWAGTSGKPSAEYTTEERLALVCEAKAASHKASEFGISLSTECHDGSLTDCLRSQLLFLNEVNRPNFRTYWQELLNLPENEQIPSLSAVRDSGKLTNIHVYQYKVFDGGRERQLISAGFDKWKERFELFKNDTSVRYALLEFVKDNSEESFLDDAKTLRALTKN